VPYFALVYAHSRARAKARGEHDARAASASASGPGVGAPREPPGLAARLTRSLALYLPALWLVAYAEELLWDRAVWHDRSWLFGEPWDIGAARLVVVPLLALPQLTHYVLDGFIWRRRKNPSVDALVRPATAPAATS